MSFCEDYPELCGDQYVPQEAYGVQVTPEDYGLDFSGPEGVSMTKQSMRDEMDINNIVARYMETGMFPVSPDQQIFEDLSEIEDYQTVRNRLVEAEAVFMQLPAKVRTRFNNNASEFIDFMVDPANLAEGRELGLFKPEEAKPVDQVPGPGIQGRDPVTGQFTSPQ